MSSYFYLQADKDSVNADFLERLSDYSIDSQELVYVLNRPLGDSKYKYGYDKGLIILSPKHKILIINAAKASNDFDDYVDDIIEDIGSISDKFLYKDIIGRPRVWRDTLINSEIALNYKGTIDSLFEEIKLTDPEEIKKVDLLISLFIGSINDMSRVKGEVPITLLDKVKQKIQLFDGDQTKFIYETLEKKRIRIQGLSGTGKTELLLHKLKDIYTTDLNSKIHFTCHNKILADNLRKRIPTFFNFMKVEKQIEWGVRLWCNNAWGGSYKNICNFYGIPYYSYSYQMSFSRACQFAIKDINAKYPDGEIPFALTHMFIDESQDFDEHFFQLCSMVTEKNIYIAGDIFQSIFDSTISSSIDPDFLLGKCYRTDPKTLMFAHALGMGLFEDAKLRWLELEEWKACGYNVYVDEVKEVHLSREPLRRFEDLEDDFASIEIVTVVDKFSDTVVDIIKKIKEDNTTVSPDDIAIILLDNNQDVYILSDALEVKIFEAFDWKVNKAYESKEKIAKTVLISNRNNVKGLEFPFVICITRSITKGPMYRNSLYTMLTRSFIKSYLVIPRSKTSGLTKKMQDGLAQILKDKEMVIKEPSQKEKLLIQTKFNYSIKNMSYYDIMMEIFIKLDIEKPYHDKLINLAKDMELTDEDNDVLESFVTTNYKFLKKQKTSL